MNLEILIVLLLAVAGSAVCVGIVNLVATLWYKLQEFQEECLGSFYITETTGSTQPEVLPIRTLPESGTWIYAGPSSVSIGLKGVIRKSPLLNPKYNFMYVMFAGARNLAECRQLWSSRPIGRTSLRTGRVMETCATTRSLQLGTRNQFPIVLVRQPADRHIVLQPPLVDNVYEPTTERYYPV
jgi:hypothetical protein